MTDSDFLSRLEELWPVMRAIAHQWSRDCPAEKDDLLQEMTSELYLILQRRPDAPREYLTAALRRIPLDYRGRGSSVDRLNPKKRQRHWHTQSLDALREEYGDRWSHHPRTPRGDGNSPVEDIVVANFMEAQLRERLTPRENAFLDLRLQGFSPDEIGNILSLRKTQTNKIAVRIRAKARALWGADGPVPGEVYATVNEAARELGVTPMTVHYYCQRGMLAGAFKSGQRWLIPRPLHLQNAPKDPATATVAEAARELCLSPVTVAQLCRQGKIEGAYRQGWLWHIPWPIRLNEDHNGYATAQEAARELGLKPVTIALLCRQGKLQGARMERNHWLIPRPIKRVENQP